MTMVVTTFALGSVVFFAVGFALMYGGSAADAIGNRGSSPHEISITLGNHDFGLFGFANFFLSSGGADGALLAVFFSQAVLANVAATIPTGAMAERWKFRAFVYFVLFMVAIVYPVFGNWVWGGGWLAKLGPNLGNGFVDFAGSSVIHLVGGMAAVAGCRALGPRLGKYNRDGSPNVLLPHSVPLYMAGTMILAFGWFALIAGRGRWWPTTCSLAASRRMLCSPPRPALPPRWSTCGRSIKSPTPALSAMACSPVWSRSRHHARLSAAGRRGDWPHRRCARRVERVVPRTSHSARRPGRGDQRAWHQRSVGRVGRRAVCGWTLSWRNRPVSRRRSAACSQAIGLVACVVWAFVTSWIFFRIIGGFVGNRVGPTTELQGLDVPELGVVGYFNEDPAAAKGSTSRAFAEPRAAVVPPPASENRFSIVIEGTDAATVKAIWNELCQPSDRPSDPDFVAVYPLMTLIKGNRFRFRGGQPDDVRSRMERLVSKRLPEKAIRARGLRVGPACRAGPVNFAFGRQRSHPADGTYRHAQRALPSRGKP